MDRAPLPPHERPWRHPSELGPPSHEPTSTSGRVIIVTTATLSLLMVGILAISMTPGKGQSPLAISSTTGARSSVVALEQPRLPLVTPIGDDGWGITTTGAVRATSGVMSARLPNGAIVDVEIVQRDEDAGLTLVSLPSVTSGYALATSTPAPHDTVAVYGAKQTQVAQMATLSTMVVEEGAPVLDDDGDLVGLCTTDATDHSVQVLTVATMPGPSTTTTAPRQPTTVAPTSVSPTTVPVTAPPSTAPATRPSTTPTTNAPTTAPSSSSTVTTADAAATPGSS